MAPILDSEDTEHFPHCRRFCWTALLKRLHLPAVLTLSPGLGESLEAGGSNFRQMCMWTRNWEAGWVRKGGALHPTSPGTYAGASVGMKAPGISCEQLQWRGVSPAPAKGSRGWGSALLQAEWPDWREEVCTFGASNNHLPPSGQWLPLELTSPGEAGFHPGLGEDMAEACNTAHILTASTDWSPWAHWGWDGLTASEPLAIPEFLTDPQDQYSDCFTSTNQHFSAYWPFIWTHWLQIHTEMKTINNCGSHSIHFRCCIEVLCCNKHKP